MTLSSNTILVTGGTGLLGSHLLYALAIRGENPRAVFRSKTKKEQVKKVFSYYTDNPDLYFRMINWVQADLTSREELVSVMKECSTVYHCAAEVSFDPSQKNKITENNVLITRNIVDLCIELGVSKLCHVSSVAAIGGTARSGMIDEDTDWDESVRHSAYAVSKRLSEEVVRKGIEKGLNAVIVNPSVIFGPGNWDHGSSEFFSGIRRGMIFYTNGITGYVDVRDVADSMIYLMDSDISGERFIISSENLTFREIFSAIAQNLGARKPWINSPEMLSWPAMGIIKLISLLTGRESPVTGENLRSAYSRHLYDNRKIRRESGIEFISVRKSIEDTCRIFLRELNMVNQ